MKPRARVDQSGRSRSRGETTKSIPMWRNQVQEQTHPLTRSKPSQVRLPRTHSPPGPAERPCAITFSDGSKQWQSGPQLPQPPEGERPMRSVEDTAQARDCVAKMQRKAFSAALAGNQLTAQHLVAVRDSVQSICRNGPVAAVQQLDEKRPSRLRRLVWTRAWTWRAAKEFLHARRGDEEKWEVVLPFGCRRWTKKKKLHSSAYAWLREGVLFPGTTARLIVNRHRAMGVLMNEE